MLYLLQQMYVDLGLLDTFNIEVSNIFNFHFSKTNHHNLKLFGFW